VVVGGAQRVGVAEVDLVLAEGALALEFSTRTPAVSMARRIAPMSGSTRAVPSSE
jgi:hypothetical protein